MMVVMRPLQPKWEVVAVVLVLLVPALQEAVMVVEVFNSQQHLEIQTQSLVE